MWGFYQVLKAVVTLFVVCNPDLKIVCIRIFNIVIIILTTLPTLSFVGLHEIRSNNTTPVINQINIKYELLKIPLQKSGTLMLLTYFKSALPSK